jgi:hypothetical protein
MLKARRERALVSTSTGFDRFTPGPPSGSRILITRLDQRQVRWAELRDALSAINLAPSQKQKYRVKEFRQRIHTGCLKHASER